MQLNRFQYDQKKQETQKLNSEFSFPESLNLESFASQYFEQAKQQNKNKSFLMESYLQKPSVLRSEEWQYNLKGVIIHKGDSAESGHYYSLVKVFNRELNQYQWKKLDDNYVTTFNFELMKQECYGGNDNEKSAYILIYEKEIQQNLQLSIVQNEDNKNDESNYNMYKQELQEIKNQLNLPENDIYNSLEIPEKQFSNSRLVDINAFKFYFNNISHEIYEISLYQDQFFYNFMVNQVQKFIQCATQKYLLNDQNQVKSNLIENQLNAMNNFQIPKNVEIFHLMNEKEKEITNQIIQILEILIFKSLENEQRTLMLGELSQILEFSPQLANQFLKNVQIENLIYDKIQKLHQSQKFKLQLNYFLVYIIKIVQSDQQNIFEYLVFLKSILPLTGMVINEDQYVDDIFLQQFDKLCSNEKQICVNCESENKLSQINCQVCSLRIDKFQKRCVNMNCNLKSDINSNYCRCGQPFNQEEIENIYENCKYCNMPNERGMKFCKNETCVFYNQPFNDENSMINQQQQQQMQQNAYNNEDNNKLEQKKENKNNQGYKPNLNIQEQKLGLNQKQDINKKKKDKKKGCSIF
ncbi:hypothetical protein PPERSA_09541 [Pseudocohnilembus persalinus]|uniref:USP domain-containing protein n=1 Tax=Pseudocohnilembus persalinus TaxID=266149 RepID=A0A0V0QFH2_PSEPJ|nr:hypothetical protein PPERSA_09541 [Pseudocohnilembus persalinus]|eukprot:KRX00935.1 hypothetical protein PPERSA_09541 [Pseudocohnilembus persalinus]